MADETQVVDTVKNTEEVKKTTKTTKKKETAKETKEPIRKKAVKIELNEMIPVRSVTKGGLTYISPKTGLTVMWSDYNTEEYMEFGELLTMKASKMRFLTEPYVVVDDDTVAEKLGLSKLYEDMIDIEDIEDFYEKKVEKMEEILKKVPRGIRKLIADKSRELIQKGSLFDIRKIKLLEKELEIDLQILME